MDSEKKRSGSAGTAEGEDASSGTEKSYSTQTRLIYGRKHTTAWDYSHHVVPPLSKSSTYRLLSAERGAEGFGAIGKRYADDPDYNPIFVYDRMGEPSNIMLEHALATAEGKEIALTFATGMSAVAASCCAFMEADAEIISHKTVYGCTYSLFQDWMPRSGHAVHFVDLTKADSFIPLVNENTRILYLESPANPTLELLDIEAIAKELAEINKSRPEDRQILTVMDNTFATPACQRPGEFGIDVVVHSLTKGLCGFGTAMGGAVVTDRKHRDSLMLYRKDFGGTLSPDSAWHILVYGISTLPLRMKKQQESAIQIARYLQDHPMVESVLYPGLESFPQYDIAKRLMRDYEGNFAPGMMIYFALKGESPEASKRKGELMMNFVADHSYCITLAVSLGQLRTLVEHPGSMTHAAYSAEEQVKRGMHPGGIRLAVGIETADDLIADLEKSLEHASGKNIHFSI